MTGPYFGQQPPPYGPPGLFAPFPEKPWWRRRLWLFGSLAVVLVLVAGLITWVAWSTAARQSRAPFDAAVTNLAAAQAVHYQSSDGDGMRWDVRVTSHDEAVGTIDVAGQELDVFAVGGKTFIKLPDQLPADLDPTTPASVAEGKWITGSDITGNAVIGPVLKQLLTPTQLAAKLRAALSSKTTAFPPSGDPGTRIDGVLALKAGTPIGDLYVSKNAPYRVLRLASPPKVAAGSPNQIAPTGRPSLPNTTASQPASVHGADFRLDQGAPQSDPSESESEENPSDTDLPEMSPEDVDDTYDEAISDTLDASDGSVDEDIQFNLDGNADVNCGDAGCTVTVNATSETTDSQGNSGITGGDVTAEMTATVTIDGLPAGGCTSTASLPLNGTGEIGCADPGAGPVFSEQWAEKGAEAQAEADAEAEQGGEAVVPYQVDYTGEAYVNATAQIDATREVQQEENEEQAADQAPSARADNDGSKPSFPPPTEITGTTEHGEQQISGRDGHGVNDAALQDAVQHPTKAPRYRPDKYGGVYRYVGKNATVNLNKNGEIVTAWARNKSGWRNP